MPYRSEKIKIVGTVYDRRIKITEEIKVEIEQLYSIGISQTQIAKRLGIDRGSVADVLFPERKEKRRIQSIENSRKYRERMLQDTKLREKATKAVRESRQHKQKLYKKGLIEL